VPEAGRPGRESARSEPLCGRRIAAPHRLCSSLSAQGATRSPPGSRNEV